MAEEKKPKVTTELDDVIEELGRHFNIRGKSAFINLLIELEDHNPGMLAEAVEKAQKVPESQLGDLFLTATEGSLGIHEILEEAKTVLGSADKAKAAQMIRILYEPDQLKGPLSDLAVRVPKRKNDGKEGWSGTFWEDGHANRKTDSSDANADDEQRHNDVTGSVRGLMWTEAVAKAMAEQQTNEDGRTTSEDEKESNPINSNPPDPDKTSPNVACFLINDPHLSPVTKDASAVGLFLSFCPTLELSRAQPYLDIQLISSRGAVTEEGRIDTLSLSQFLLGNADIKTQGTPTEVITTAVLENVLSSPQYEDPDSLKDIATAGMELFTAPQMLVPADELWSSPDMSSIEGDGADGSAPLENRGTPLIDRFRPLATITGFSVNVTPTGGMMSHKTAELTLTLHDRSRLSEIGELIKPDMYGDTEFLITYGWTHPDGIDLAKAPGHSPFGSIVNAMRKTEKFKIKSSSFSFDESGQVNITLGLFTVDMVSFDTKDISAGPLVSSAHDEVKRLLKIIRKIKRQTKKSGDAGSTDVSGDSWLGSISSPNSIRGMDKKTVAAMRQWQWNNRRKTEGTTGELVAALGELLGTKGDVSKGALGNLDTTIQKALAGKKELLQSHEAGDPFFRPVHPDNGYCDIRIAACDPQLSKDKATRPFTSNPDLKNWNLMKRNAPHPVVSLGKLLLTYAITPLAMDDKFDEVQIFFYTFNDQCSFMSGRNIAEFPIRLKDFEKELSELTKKTNAAFVPVKRFLGMLNSKFVSKTYNPAYGLSGLYAKDKEGNWSYKKKYKNNPTAALDEKQKILRFAEDPTAKADNNDNTGAQPEANLRFRKPRLAMYTECLPRKNSSESKPGKSFTILKIHIYDKACTPHQTIGNLLKATVKDGNGQISLYTRAEKKAGDRKDWVDQYLAREGILEAAEKCGIIKVVSGDEIGQKTAKIIGGFSGIKSFVKSQMPSIIYGAQYSGVLSAQMSSMSDSGMASIHMLRESSPTSDSPSGIRAAGLPFRVSPTELSLEVVGCPIIEFGQQFFVDMGTGTTVDNVYAVVAIDHTLEQGTFTTSLKLKQLDAYGVYESQLGIVNRTLAALQEDE